jgi:hypothetical protein
MKVIMILRNIEGLSFQERPSVTGRVEGTYGHEMSVSLLNNDENQLAGFR